MGEVKETVKGKALKKQSLKKTKISGDNIIEYLDSLRDEVSKLTQIKDDDTLDEGDDKKAENTQKAGRLRAVYSLLTAAKTILEDY